MDLLLELFILLRSRRKKILSEVIRGQWRAAGSEYRRVPWCPARLTSRSPSRGRWSAKLRCIDYRFARFQRESISGPDLLGFHSQPRYLRR